FRGQQIFITGTTGFVGKCVLEKVLRELQDVQTVYILIRAKKGASPQQRAQREIATSPIFNLLRSTMDDFDAYFEKKVVAVAGDINQDFMGLSQEDLARVSSSVNFLIHCAANVDFNERLDGAITTNCRGPLRMMRLAERCPNLKAYVHVSTAYVNCNRPSGSLVAEELPLCQSDGEQVMKEIEKLAVPELEARTRALLQAEKYPNTYTFTKAMGEKLLHKYHGNIPVAIVRPTIIGAAWREPAPGWVDTVSAGGALFLSGGMGFMPVQSGDPELVGDQIPVDLVTNAILVAAAEACSKGPGFFRIYHSGSSTRNPVRWSLCAEAVARFWKKRPSSKSQLKCQYTMVKNPLVYHWRYLRLVSLPALALGVYSKLSSSEQVKKKSAMFNKVMKRSRTLAETFHHFVNNEWFYESKNLLAASASMPDRDRSSFPVDPAPINWRQYLDDFSWGLQRFILRDDVAP
ncbi:hypothetical protein GUITHDRAFT_55447, partial [Guillardia theta CCMP2712]